MGLSPNTTLAAIPEIRPNFPKNFSAYIAYKPQNLFEKFVSDFCNFASKAHSATGPVYFTTKALNFTSIF